MYLIIVLLFICFFIFLFSLYFLANDDLVIIRKDMPMEKIFNTAFLTALAALFFARLFYVFFYPKEVFFSILGFLLFPYFPGLSLIGGVLGGAIFLLVYAKYQKLPVAKLFDFFSIGLLSSLPIGTLGYLILTGKNYIPIFIFSFLCYVVLLFLFIKVFLPLSFRSKIKNGSLGIMFLMCFSVVTFFSKNIVNFKLISLENLIVVITFLVSLILFIKQEMLKAKGIKR